MSVNVKILDSVKSHVIALANSNGINLAAEFGTQDKFYKFVFAVALQAIIDALNIPVEAAYEVIMGDGSWRQLSDDVWGSITADI